MKTYVYVFFITIFLFVYQIDASEKEKALAITKNNGDLGQLDEEFEMANIMSSATIGNTEMNTEDRNTQERWICSICTEIPASGNAYTTVCHHVFCKDCLFEWLKINQHCPNCRWWLEEFEDDILPGRAQNPRLPRNLRAQNPRLPEREQNPRLPESTDYGVKWKVIFGEVIPFYYIALHPLVIALMYCKHELGESECTPSRHLLNWSGFIVAFLRMFVARYSEQLRIQWIEKKYFEVFFLILTLVLGGLDIFLDFCKTSLNVSLNYFFFFIIILYVWNILWAIANCKILAVCVHMSAACGKYS